LKGLTITAPRFVDTGTAKFDLALELEAATGKGGFFEYSTDLFRESTIAQMAKDFEAILRALIAQPDVPLSDVPAVREIRQRIRNVAGVRR
jgi:non-ribosomal peptide synthetase component F